MTKLSIMRLSLAALAFAALAPAQETKETPNPSAASTVSLQDVQRIYRVLHAEPRALFGLIASQQGVRVSFDNSLMVITVSGPRGLVENVLATLKELDAPQSSGEVFNKNIELTAWIVAASHTESTGGPLPAELEPVLKPIRSALGFKSFKLLDAPLILGKTGQRSNVVGNASLAMDKAPPGTLSEYILNISFGRASKISREGAILQVENLRFNLKAPYCADQGCVNTRWHEINLDTRFDLREGQKIVVGKSKMADSDRGLILIVSAKVVD